MSVLVSLEDISIERASKRLFNRVSLGINTGDAIGVVGANGGGKSTLLQLITRSLTPDSVRVIARRDLSVSYLSQTPDFADDTTVERACFGDVPAYEYLQRPQARDLIAHLLGAVSWDKKVGELSGGLKRRLDLIRVLLEDADLLLLDEPTNHLDMRTIAWLSTYLVGLQKNTSKAMVIVTHDRWFLDEVCNHMWEVHDGCCDPFEGGYSSYVQLRFERARLQDVREAKRQNLLRQELNWLCHGARARSSKPKFRIDRALELIGDAPAPRAAIELNSLRVSRLGKQVITLKNVSLSYENTPIFSAIDWIIGAGERIGILGDNGSGKSSLLRIMCANQLPTTGFVKIGKTVTLGIVSQELDVFKDADDSQVDHILASGKRSVMIEGKRVSTLDLFERLGFRKEDRSLRIKELSGGQKRRLAILLCLLSAPNVMVLDEPGNDLDTDMLQALEDVLDGWQGTLILVTHDRHLIERACDDLYGLVGQHLVHMPRGVDQFLECEEVRTGAKGDKAAAATPAFTSFDKTTRPGVSEDTRAELHSSSPVRTQKERYELKKELDRTWRLLTRAQEEAKSLSDELNSSSSKDYVFLAGLQEKLDQAQARVDELETKWIELSDALEQ